MKQLNDLRSVQQKTTASRQTSAQEAPDRRSSQSKQYELQDLADQKGMLQRQSLRKPTASRPEPQAARNPVPAQSTIAASDPVQRMIIPIGEVASLPHTHTRQDREAADVIDHAHERVHNARNGATVRLSQRGNPLERLGRSEELIILAHGGRYGTDDGPVDQFGGYTPSRLAQALLAVGLSTDYSGTIYLNGCNSATSGPGRRSYAKLFQIEMSNRGYHVSVKGNKANSHVMADGRTGFLKSGAKTQKDAVKSLVEAFKSKEAEYQRQLQLLKAPSSEWTKPGFKRDIGLSETASPQEVEAKLSQIQATLMSEAQEFKSRGESFNLHNEEQLWEVNPAKVEHLPKPDSDNQIIGAIMALGLTFLSAYRFAPEIGGYINRSDHFVRVFFAIVCGIAFLGVLYRALTRRF
ncbi:MAG: hypothetical protein EP338_06325 [Bacteroidetes bacterium]|nr:MAG: hypothetical protein EP338_06325 [Bacteroidota bacterium]